MAATLGKDRTKVVGLFLTPLIVFALACCATAQTNTFIGGSGNWSPPQAWSLQHDPNRSENVVVPAGSSPISDLGLECLTFSMGSNATLLLTPGYLFPYGSLANQGVITVGPGNGLSFQQNSGTVSISGGGTITLAKGSITTGSGLPETLVNIDHVISGQGAILVNQFTNQATINANSSGNSLSVQTSTAGFTNTGTLEASNGGTLLVIGGAAALNNTGGTIQALNGSTVQLEGYTFSGGTLTTSGSGTIQNINSSYYSNLTNNGAFQTINGNYAIFEGTIVNNGTFSAPNGGYQINGNVTLKGTGTVSGGNAGLFHSSFVGGGTLTLQQPLSGGGSIGDTSFNFTNQSTVTANNTSANLVLAGNPAVNTGTLQASGGATLEIQIPVNNNGGTITAQNGSTVLLDSNGTIAGGTLTTSGNGNFQTTSGTLDGTVNVPTNAGLFTVAAGATLNTKGTVNNTGTIALGPNGGCIALATSTTITGSGQVAMTPNSCFLSSPGLTLTNQSTISGAGSIGDSNPMGIINQGNITANQSTALVIQPDNTGFTNSGTLTVNSGAVMQLNIPFNNLVNGTLTGGTYNVSGTLQFWPQGSITTNNAAITLGSASAQITNGIGGPSALAALATNGPKGVFSVQSGQILTTSANFTNQGTVTIGTGSGFGVGGTYTQTAGTTTVDGVISAPSGFLLNKGKLFGSGTISGAVTAGAAVTAGDSLILPGTLSVSAYSQTSKGSLTIPFTKSSYGQVASANGAAVAGKLLLKLAKGYAPAIGSTFNIVTGTAISGRFTNPNLKINRNEHFSISYGPTAVTLTVVQGP